MTEPCRRICLWSGPRNVSTALLYAFAQRADTRVVDEPLYAHYLRVSGAVHPGGDEVLAAQDGDGDRVIEKVILGPCERPVLFVKLMAHHLVGELDMGFVSEAAHAFLVRDPREMLPSLIHQVPEPELADTGIDVQARLFEELARQGETPPVIDAAELLRDPPAVLATLCRRLGLVFEPAMLTWPAGPKPYDGVWAPHWYHNVHRSTGFMPYRPKTAPFPERLEPLLAACRPFYETLRAAAIEAPRS